MSQSGPFTESTELTFDPAPLEAALAVLVDARPRFARLSAADKADLCERTVQSILAQASRWVEVCCAIKGHAPGSLGASEEWMAGPLATVRVFRLMARTLRQLSSGRSLSLGRRTFTRADGRLVADVFPADLVDRLFFRGLRGEIVFQEGIDEAQARSRQASFYKHGGEGGILLVLGAGNVSSIPPLDAAHGLFAEGHLVLCKLNPVNEALLPVFESAFAPLIEAGFLRFVTGGAEAGAMLCQHSKVDRIHITGSDATHDRIVWGPPGPETDQRRRGRRPLLRKPITSELGNISPVIVVPGSWTADDIRFQAENIAAQLVNNASFNCNAAKMLVTQRYWKHTAQLMEELGRVLQTIPVRRAYYPGAFDRYDRLTQGREVRTYGVRTADALPWTIITGVDPRTPDPLYRTEPFCPILTHVEVEGSNTEKFLQSAVDFCNLRLWGTLNACIVIDPRTEASIPGVLEAAIADLEYGTVAVNVWPAVAYALGVMPWGGHPRGSLDDVQSGMGWVHNTQLLEGIEKGVVRGPFRMRPKPAWFPTHRTIAELAPALTVQQAEGGLWPLVRLLPQAMRG